MQAALYTSKQSFWKNINFGSVTLAFHYRSFFNASSSRHTFQIYLVFKHSILSKEQVQTSVEYPMESLMLSCSCINQELR